jgi:hypothetical protein
VLRHDFIIYMQGQVSNEVLGAFAPAEVNPLSIQSHFPSVEELDLQRATVATL